MGRKVISSEKLLRDTKGEDEMPFCPKCGYEYEPGHRRCPDCDEELVDGLPAEDEPVPEVKWVALHPLPGPLYAEMVKEVLDRRGIPCIIQSDVLSSAYGAKGATLPGMQSRILVPEDRAEEARQLLFQMLDHI